MFVDEAPDDLAVFQDKWGFVAADLKHAARACAACFGLAKSGVEKACVMDAKFANHREIGGHFGGVVRGDDDRFAADENVERAWVKDDPAGVCAHLFPVVRRGVVSEF